MGRHYTKTRGKAQPTARRRMHLEPMISVLIKRGIMLGLSALLRLNLRLPSVDCDQENLAASLNVWHYIWLFIFMAFLTIQANHMRAKGFTVTCAE